MLLNLLLVLLVAWLAGLAVRRLGYPAVLGELVAGIVLGPPLLGLLEGGEALAVLAEVGILLMMLYIGMEIDPAELGRASKAGLLAAFGGFVVPFGLCYGLVLQVGGSQLEAVFVGMAAGVTSLATKSRVLLDLKLFDTRIAHVMMAGALVTDTVTLLLFAFILAVAEVGSPSAATLAPMVGRALLFFVVAGVLVWKVLPAVGWRLQRLKTFGRTSSFTFVLLVALAFAEMAELAGLHGILGTFLAGMFLREGILGRTRAKEQMELVHHASIGFLAPIFFVTAGFAVSLDVFTQDLGLLLALAGLATVGKIAGTALFYLPTGYGWREGLTIGMGMNGRGAVEIILAQIAMEMGLISQEIFSILIFIALSTTALEPVMLRWGVAWLRRSGALVRTHDRRGVLLVGAGPTARALARILARSQPVRLVDRNRELCAFAASEDLPATCGNALDEAVLEAAGAAHVQTFVSITPNAEVNIVAAQLARDAFGVPEVLVLHAGDEAGHAAVLDHLHVATLFAGPVDLAEWDYRVDHDQVAREGLPLTGPELPGVLFEAVQHPRRSLPLAVRHGDDYLPFHSASTLQAGDRLIVLQAAETRPPAFDRFDRLVARCPVLDLDGPLDADAFFGRAAEALAHTLHMAPVALAAHLNYRETLSSTVLLPGLAIPHAVVEGQGRFELLLARCRDGIRFPAQAAPVHAVFVLVGTDDERNLHLRALSAIAQIVQAPAFDSAWLRAPDAAALRNLILHATRRRTPERAKEEVRSMK